MDAAEAIDLERVLKAIYDLRQTPVGGALQSVMADSAIVPVRLLARIMHADGRLAVEWTARNQGMLIAVRVLQVGVA